MAEDKTEDSIVEAGIDDIDDELMTYVVCVLIILGWYFNFCVYNLCVNFSTIILSIVC